MREIAYLAKKDDLVLDELKKIAKADNYYDKLAGEILLKAGKIKEAKKFLIRSLDTPSLLQFATLCFTQGYYAETQESLNKILNKSVEPLEKERALLLQAHTYEKLKQYDNSIKSLDKILEQGMTLKDSALIEKAQILIDGKKEFEKGLRAIEPLLHGSRNLNQRKILSIATSAYIKTDNLDKAKKLLENSALPFSIYLKAELQFLAQAYQESKKNYLTAVSRGLDKEYSNNALERVMLIETLGKRQNLLSTVSNIEKMIWQEKFEDAIHLINVSFDRFTEKQDESVLLFLKGKIYALMGKTTEAISSYESIFGENKESLFAPKSLYLAALLYMEKVKNLKMAENLFEKIIIEYPESVEAELARGEIEAMEKQHL